MADEETKIDLGSLTAAQVEQLKKLILGDVKAPDTNINVNLKSKKQKTLNTGQPDFLDLLKGKKKPNVIMIQGYKYIQKGDSLIPQWGAIAHKTDYGSKNWKKSPFSAWKEAVRKLGEGDL